MVVAGGAAGLPGAVELPPVDKLPVEDPIGAITT